MLITSWIVKKRLLVFIGLMFTIMFNVMSVAAQNTRSTIMGTIISQEAQYLFPATVSLKGTGYGTSSKKDGTFNLEIPSGSYTLVVSFTGFKPYEKSISVKSGDTLDMGQIMLEKSTEMIKEVTASAMINKFSKKESAYVSKMPLKNLENIQVYTVVPKELFTEQVAVDFRSALMTSPGLANVTLGLGSGGTGLAMHLRGFSGANGAGAIRNGMSTNWVSLSDPANLESLEIIKGPSSTLYGTTLISYGGLVNRVTKKPKERKLTEVAFSTGSFGLGRLALDFNSPLNDDKTFLFRMNTAIQREKSFQDYGISKTIMVAPTFTYLVSDRLKFDVDLEYFESNQNTTYLRISSSAPMESMDDLNWNFNRSYTSNGLLSSAKVFNGEAKATYKMSDNWTSQSVLSYSNTDNNANYLFLLVTTDIDSLTRRVMNIPSMFNTLEFQQNFTGNFKLGSVKNKILVGIDYTQLQTNDTRSVVVYDKIALTDEDVLNVDAYQQMLSDTDPYFMYKRDRQTYSIYASDVVYFTDRLIGMLSLRGDHFVSNDDDDEYNQTSWSPKFGMIFKVVDDKLSLFANLMDGFKNVSPATTATSMEETVDMKPEHATQYEGGIKFELVNGKLNGTLSYYDIQVRNTVRSVTDADENTYSVQDGTQESKGFEIDIIANPVPGMNIILGYGYNKSEYTNADEDVNGHTPYGVPHNVGNFWLSYRLMDGSWKGIGCGFGGNFADDHYLHDANTITVPGYHKMDATLFYEQPKFRIGLKLNNITDEEYWMSDYDAEPQKARAFIGNLTLKF